MIGPTSCPFVGKYDRERCMYPTGDFCRVPACQNFDANQPIVRADLRAVDAPLWTLAMGMRMAGVAPVGAVSDPPYVTIEHVKAALCAMLAINHHGMCIVRLGPPPAGVGEYWVKGCVW